MFLRPRHDLRSYLLPEKTASVMCLDAVLGKVHLPCWRFIVVRHGGNVHRYVSIAFCSSDESPPSFFHSSNKHVFSRSRWSESRLHTIDPLRHFTSSLVLSSVGVAPLPPCPRKLLDETVKTFAVFPSWLHLLDGEDSCMLSVPLSTIDLHYSRWQSGENCQVVSARAFKLLCHAFWFSLKGLFLSFFVLPTRLSAR